MLGGQGPAHGQVDNVSYDSQGEGGAQHVLPFTHRRQDGCRETRSHKPGAVMVCGSDTGVITTLNQANISAEAAAAYLTPEESPPLCPCDKSLAGPKARIWPWPPPPTKTETQKTIDPKKFA